MVVSESCPIPSLMMEMGMFLLFAILAQEWRATYMERGYGLCTSEDRFFSFLLTSVCALRYCFRASVVEDNMMGNKYSVGLAGYWSKMSCMHFSHLMESIWPVFLRR